MLATLPYTAAAVYAVARGGGAQERLDRLPNWLIVRNRTISGSVAIVIGLALVAKSLVSLL